MTTTDNSRADALTEYAGNVNRLIGGLWIERAVDGRGELERLLRDVREATSTYLSASPVEQPRTYTTQPGESVMGIALRQCGNEMEWRHILACNPEFARMLPHEYFPVGTVLTLPSPPAAASSVEQHEAAPADARACTCGMTMGHTRTCAAFDESMMRAETCAVCHATPGQWQCPKSTNDLYNPPPEAACRASQPAPSAPLEGTGNGADEQAAWFSAVMNAAASLEDAANWLTDPDSKRITEGAAAFARKRANELWNARAPRTEVAGAVPIAMETRDTKDARYFRWLCAHPDWHFIESLCQQFVAESQVEFYTKLSAEIEKRIKHGANKGKKRLPNGSLVFPDAVAAAPQPPSTDAAAAPADERAAFDMWFTDAWNAYLDKETTSEIKSKVWALKAWRHLFPRAAASQPAADDSMTLNDAARQYRGGVHIGSGLPFSTCPCGLCKKVRGIGQPAAAAGQEVVAWQVRRADGRIDGVSVQWENCTKDLYDATLFTGRYAGYENGPRCEVRALYTAPPAQVATRQAMTNEQRENVKTALNYLDDCGGFEPEVKLLRALLDGDKHE